MMAEAFGAMFEPWAKIINTLAQSVRSLFETIRVIHGLVQDHEERISRIEEQLESEWEDVER